MAPLQAQLPDAGAGGLRHPQPVERGQRDQRVPGGRPQPGGGQERAQLVAACGGGVRPVVQPGPADARGRRAAGEFPLDGVLAGPGDGAQPPGHGRPRPPAPFQFPGEGPDAGPADREQGQRPGPAPAGELAQAGGAGLAGQAAVPGREPGEREPPGTGEGRPDGDEGQRKES